MACNSIRHLYLLAFMSGETDFAMAASTKLDKDILESKRKGFVEFTGILNGSSTSGHAFSFMAKKNSSAPLVINILGKNSHHVIIKAE